MLDDPVGMLHADPGDGPALSGSTAVTTASGAHVRARIGTVVAAGVWSGQLLAEGRFVYSGSEGLVFTRTLPFR